MKLRNMKSDDKPLLMVIPMIDIIFFLLVFFMMSMLSMVTQRTIPLNLPTTATAKVDTTVTVPVSVDSRGQIYYEMTPVDLETLSASLAAKRLAVESQTSADGTPAKTLTVVLRGDKTAPYGTVIDVMDLVKTLGIERLSIATDRR